MNKNIKICIVSSVGGHLSEIRQLRYIYSKYDHFYILNDDVFLYDDMKGRTYFITRPKNRVPVFINLYEVLKIFKKERPDVVISCGAGHAVPAFFAAKLLGAKTIFIETFCVIKKPSLTGRIIYNLRLYDHFFVQWKELLNCFPKARYEGVIYDIRNYREWLAI